MDVNGEGGENLANFLESISLSHYQDAIRNELKVCGCTQKVRLRSLLMDIILTDCALWSAYPEIRIAPDAL